MTVANAFAPDLLAMRAAPPTTAVTTPVPIENIAARSCHEYARQSNTNGPTMMIHTMPGRVTKKQ